MVAVDTVNEHTDYYHRTVLYNKARGSHVTKRGYTEVLAKPTKYSISAIISNNHCMTLMQGLFSLCHISLSPVRESGRWTNVSSSAGSCDNTSSQ